MKARKKRPAPSKCRPPYKISQAGHLLSMEADPEAGSILSTIGKQAKKKRLARGCLSGSGGSGKLSTMDLRLLINAVEETIIRFNHS